MASVSARLRRFLQDLGRRQTKPSGRRHVRGAEIAHAGEFTSDARAPFRSARRDATIGSVGIHPPARKASTKDVALRTAPLPRRVVLALDRGPGRLPQPLVEVGQYVRTGECIAKADGHLSSRLHASISGHVVEITGAQAGTGAGPYNALSIIIEGDGQDTSAWLAPLDWRSTSAQALIERLEQAGIAGLGGAVFPSHLKSEAARHAGVDTLIVNAAECEPYITADDVTLRTHPDLVLEGAAMLARTSGAQRIIIGIEDDKPEALAALEEAIAAGRLEGPTPHLRVVTTRYPSGGERQLVETLLGRRVPSRGLPADVGALVHNPGTLVAALRAVRDGQPLIERVVTLTGSALTRPGNVIARLGTPLAELLIDAGLVAERLERLIQGGPMMGQALASAETGLGKACNCLIATGADELPPPPPEQPCIRCGACEPVCVAGLQPQRLLWHARGQEADKAQALGLFDCIECGACDYVCPSHIPLAAYFRGAKTELRSREAEAARADHARHRFEWRQARQAREQAEKQARREARKRTLASHSPSAVDAPPSTAPDLRGLRIAQAAAKAAVRKAEKALERAAQQQEDARMIEDLETQVATARENLSTADAQLASARGEGTRS
ncbi:electron transport complex subunit RsxC [Halomonas sp. V046]|uniref:electron transport complex subunit RsxC n=1 Tax=Halomonas sp. V046 TaxID=3459611 RepID=UPI0040447143